MHFNIRPERHTNGMAWGMLLCKFVPLPYREKCDTCFLL